MTTIDRVAPLVAGLLIVGLIVAGVLYAAAKVSSMLNGLAL